MKYLVVTGLFFAVPVLTTGCETNEIVEMCLETDLSSCLEDDEDNAQILQNLGDSFHEFIACGGLQAGMMDSAADFVFDYALGESISTGFTYEGDGVYQRAPNGFGSTYMTVEFISDRDYECLPQTGEVIPHDIFNFDNYLTEAEVSGNILSGIEISYAETGPLRQLLKKSCDPDNPITYNADSKTNHLQLRTRSTYFIQDKKGGTKVNYEVAATTNRIEDFADRKIETDINSASATRSSFGQKLTIDSWDIEYEDVGSSLNNTAAFKIKGDDGTFYARFTYQNSTDPTKVKCSCKSLAD